LTVTFSQQKVTIAVGEWAPHISEELVHLGVVARIMTEAFESQGYQVEYGFFPWKRSMEYVKSGEWDASGAWSRTEDREPFFYFSDPILEVKTVIFHLKSTNVNWNSIEDLKNLKIGATIGYNYGAEFEKAEQDGILNVQRASSDETNLRKLMGGIVIEISNNISTEVITSIINSIREIR